MNIENNLDASDQSQESIQKIVAQYTSDEKVVVKPVSDTEIIVWTFYNFPFIIQWLLEDLKKIVQRTS